ncbi:unnamed protein product [Clavelina lepadiformis]|uniref:Hexosyltransferase n=1 Tax=Clavelina lepadiformis TaxID=159417 RepID=A0ABP0FTR7_CLALP
MPSTLHSLELGHLRKLVVGVNRIYNKKRNRKQQKKKKENQNEKRNITTLQNARSSLRAPASDKLNNTSWPLQLNGDRQIFAGCSDSRFTRGERSDAASLGKIVQNNFYTVFIIGKPADERQDNIRAEFLKYRYILQINNPEDYQIIGLKTLAGMKWASENLPFNYYYSTSDDDMWIDMLKVKEMIDQYRMVVMEDDWPEFPIIRTYKQQYRWPYWPTFCFGGMYTTSVNVIKQLWKLSTVTEPLYNADDVWITGLLHNKLEMPDEMVIRPEKHAAKHYRGFENEDGTVKYDVKFDEWNETLKKVQSRGVCRW